MKRILLPLSLCLFALLFRVPTYADPVSPITALAFSPDGTRLAVGMRRSVAILQMPTGKEVMRLKGSPGAVTALAFHPNGQVLAGAGGLAGRFGEIRVWNLSNGRSTAVQPHRDVTYGVAFQRGGKRLVAGSYDHLVSLSTIEGATQSQILKDHTDAVYGIAVSPDGSRIASVAGDRTLKIWDTQTGKRLFTLSESTAELYSVAFRPDGKQVCAGGADKTLRIWNLTPTAGNLAKSAFAHQGAILQVAYTPDGKGILTSGEDRAVKRWDATTLAEEQVYGHSPEIPHAIAIHPKGSLLAVGRHDGSVTIFDVKSARLVREPMKGVPLAWVQRVRTCLLPQQQQTNELKERQVGGPTLFLASAGALYPTGMQRGTSREFTVYGANLARTLGIAFDVEGIRAELRTPPSSNGGSLTFRLVCSKEVAPGIHRLRLFTQNGLTGSLAFSVEETPETAQREPNESQEQAQPISLPTTLVGAIDKPGDVDVYRFEAQAGQEIVFDAITQPLRSRLQPVLTLLDKTGKVLNESRPRSGRRDVAVGYHFTQSGAYSLRVSDFENQSGGDVTYRIIAGQFPYVERHFPLGISKGIPSKVELVGFNLGKERQVELFPKKKLIDTAYIWNVSEPNTLSLRGANRFDLSDDPSYFQSSEALNLKTAPLVPTPVVVHGRLWNPESRSSVSHFYRFKAKRGEKVVLEVVARRRGSPLDSTIEVLDAAGNPVERAVLRAVGQTEMVLNDRDSLSSGLRLFNWDGFQMGDYLMVGREVIQIYNLPKGPDDDVQFRSVRGRRMTFLGTTPEFHSLGSPVYKVEVHPAGSKFSPNGYPLRRLYYQNDDGGVLYDRDSWLEFTAPNDATYTVRLSDTRGLQGEEFAYDLQIRPPRPSFKINASTLYPNIPQGDAELISVEAERYDGFSGAIDVAFHSPNLRVTEGTIEEGESSVVLYAKDGYASGSPLSDTLKVVADARKEGVTSQTVLPDMLNMPLIYPNLPATDIKVTTDRSEVALRPGGEATIEVRVERRGKFGKRVPIDVRNLPYGVRVQDVGLNGVLVTEDEKSRKFVLYCEPWVKPQTRLIFVSGVVEGGVNSVATPITLQIITTTARTAGRSHKVESVLKLRTATK